MLVNRGPTAAIQIAVIAAAACSTVKVPADTTSTPVDTGPAARALVEDALAAKGGKARLASLRSLRLHAVGTVTIRGLDTPFETTRVIVLPDKMRIDATLTPLGAPRVTVSTGISGETGWQRTLNPKTNDVVSSDVVGINLQQLRFELWRDPDLILLKAADPAAQLMVLPDDTVAGGDLDSVVRLRSPFGADVFLYINKQTKLLSRVVYSDGRITESSNFRDHRDVGGLQFAYKRTAGSDDRTTTHVLKTVEVNPEIDLTLFDKPATNAHDASAPTLADTPPPSDIGNIVAPPPPPPPPPPLNAMQKTLEANRIAGARNILPDDQTKLEIAESGRKAGWTTVNGSIQLCISKTGTVESVTVRRSTGFIDYDRKLQREMQQWRYRPVVLNGEPTGVCLPFTVVYSFVQDQVWIHG